MSRYESRIEKRILPLIDITVILVGILILVVGTPQIGEHQVFTLELSGHTITYGNVTISSGSEVLEEAAHQVLTRAINGGFHRIEIRSTENRYSLSALQIAEIERQLQGIALRIAEELQLPRVISIKYQYQS